MAVRYTARENRDIGNLLGEVQEGKRAEIFYAILEGKKSGVKNASSAEYVGSRDRGNRDSNAFFNALQGKKWF
jgi:hypothetical protein